MTWQSSFGGCWHSATSIDHTDLQASIQKTCVKDAMTMFATVVGFVSPFLCVPPSQLKHQLVNLPAVYLHSAREDRSAKYSSLQV